MLKINFKNPVKIKNIKHQFEFECLFLVCFGINIYTSFEVMAMNLSEFDKELYFVNTDNIQSIEHVKPTDL